VGDITMSGTANAGRRLHALAGRLVDARTLQEIVEPTLADLQYELLLAGGRVGRLRVLVSGYAAFWKVVTLQVLTGRSPMDMRRIARMTMVALLALAAYVLALQVMPFTLMAFRSRALSTWTVYVAVRGLVSLMPFAVFVAVLSGARGASTSEGSRQLGAYVMVTAAAFLAARAISLWALPAAARAVPGVLFLADWPVAVVLSWITTAVGCAAFASLALALAPHVRRTVLFALAVVLIPPLFVLSQNALMFNATRPGPYSLTVSLLLNLLSYVPILGLAALMAVVRRRNGQVPA
jgi:hypothetical protein